MMRQAALEYAELGYAVFPCGPGRKEPATEHGCLDATTDREQIERWWSSRPNANVAIATTGLLVLDLDAGNRFHADDPDKLHALAGAPASLTANGGRQYVFRQPEGRAWRNTTGRLAPKVDTRADGGYVVLPPSVLAGGKAYRWAAPLDERPDQLPLPPAWLIDELDQLATGGHTLAHDATGGEASNAIPIGQRNATLARLGGAMRRVGMSLAEIVAALIRTNADRCVPPLNDAEVERIAASVARYRPDEVSVALAEDHWEQMYANESEAASEHVDPGPIPDELLRAPGFIADVIDFTLATAPYPETTLAFCGALSLQALLAGRKIRDASDNRTALYVLGLANSGAGKDHPRKVNQRILHAVGMSDCVGDTFASGEGLEDRLALNPAVLFQTDEIDGLMTKINQAKDSRHEGIMNVLLKLYTSANTIYPMRVKAGKEPASIDQPCLCIFGTAIPRNYYEALSRRMLTNGFFARMLVLETRSRGRGQEAIVREPPSAVLETAQWWADFRTGGRGNLDALHPAPRVAQQTPEARDILARLRCASDDQYSAAESRDDPMGMAIWARANEKARRLALVHACSANPREPVIDAPAARWASAFVEHQTRRMLFMASDHVSENEFDARCKALVGTLRNWRAARGDAPMPFWRINRRHPWSAREHEEVRTTLLNQRLIEYEERKTGGSPQRMYRIA